MKPSKGPHPGTLFPLAGYDKLVFLQNIVKAENIFVGDYTYFDDGINGPLHFEERNVLYNHDTKKVKLVFGKFCAIAAETRFLMTGDHKLDCFSTYPFPLFGEGWEEAYNMHDLPVKGDIIVGDDVWFGYDSLIMNGVTIGSGAIVATRSVVKKDVPPYAIVAGNPAKVVKMRFDEKTIEKLLEISWWNWPLEKITKHIKIISHLDLEALEKAHRENV